MNAESLSMRSLGGVPTSQLSLVRPSGRCSASWPSVIWMLQALETLQTKIIAQHFDARSGLALVFLSRPGIYVVMGPYRSAWEIQKGGARA